MGAVNQTAAAELGSLTEQLRHVSALNGVAADQYSDLTVLTGSMGVFVDVRDSILPKNLKPFVHDFWTRFRQTDVSRRADCC